MKNIKRHILLVIAAMSLMTGFTSCVSRVMYEDGYFDQNDQLDMEDTQLLNSEILQDDAYHD